jgi:hypothetical protein
MFPHYNHKTRKSFEIPSHAEIKEREQLQETHKRTSTDFFKNEAKEKDTIMAEQNEEKRRLLASSSRRRPLEDITNKASSSNSQNEVAGQGKRKDAPDQIDHKKELQEQLRRQEHEKERLLQSRTKKELRNDSNRNLQDDLKDIAQSIQLRELGKFSMSNHDMKTRGVNPEDFQRVSQELSNALKNSNPDQFRIATTRKEFREMAKKLGLIRPEI